MNPYLQEESKWENTNEEEGMRSCNRGEERICAEKEKGVPIVKRGKRRGVQVHWRTIEERIYQTLKFASYGSSIFVEEKDGKKHMV